MAATLTALIDRPPRPNHKEKLGGLGRSHQARACQPSRLDRASGAPQPVAVD